MSPRPPPSGCGSPRGTRLEVSNGSGQVTAPVRITKEVADNVAALAFGQGHAGLGEIASGRGVNAFLLRTRPDGNSLFGAGHPSQTGARMPLTNLRRPGISTGGGFCAGPRRQTSVP